MTVCTHVVITFRAAGSGTTSPIINLDLNTAALTRFQDAIARMYVGRLERIVLFGSWACGDFREDYGDDIAAFLGDRGVLGPSQDL
jgi:hypothetical protein